MNLCSSILLPVSSLPMLMVSGVSSTSDPTFPTIFADSQHSQSHGQSWVFLFDSKKKGLVNDEIEGIQFKESRESV